jgi:hypothetical protein
MKKEAGGPGQHGGGQTPPPEAILQRVASLGPGIGRASGSVRHQNLKCIPWNAGHLFPIRFTRSWSIGDKC